jgi:Predicted acyltransferase
MPKNLSPVIIKTFHELDKEELYKFMQLRIEVFIVEQDCPYQDLDDLDAVGKHLWIEEDGVVLTYLRLNPPETRFKEPSLGRIVTKEIARSRGLAEALIVKALEIIDKEYKMNTRISAQSYLEEYYSKLAYQSSENIHRENF